MIESLVLMDIKGEQIHLALENGVSQWPKLDGRFPQVGGITFAFDPTKPPGSRIDPAYIKVGTEYMDRQQHYKLATKASLANGEDGYSALSQGQIIIWLSVHANRHVIHEVWIQMYQYIILLYNQEPNQNLQWFEILVSFSVNLSKLHRILFWESFENINLSEKLCSSPIYCRDNSRWWPVLPQSHHRAPQPFQICQVRIKSVSCDHVTCSWSGWRRSRRSRRGRWRALSTSSVWWPNLATTRTESSRSGRTPRPSSDRRLRGELCSWQQRWDWDNTSYHSSDHYTMWQLATYYLFLVPYTPLCPLICKSLIEVNIPLNPEHWIECF